MKHRPRLTVTAAGKVVGHVSKGKSAWHFQPGDGLCLVATPTPQMTLKDLGVEIEKVLGTKGIQFKELALIKRAPKRPKNHRKRRKLSSEEWLEIERLERKQARYFPRTASIETRGNHFGRNVVAGGTPGLGKRR